MDDKVTETISASRVPALLGLDKRCSPLTLYLRLRGEIDERAFDDSAMKAGRYYERATAEWSCDEYGMQIVPGYEQMTLRRGVFSGHPDFVVRDEHGKLAICEVKNPFWSYKGDDWGESGTDQVPKAHFVQSMIYAYLVRKDLGPDAADYAYVVAKLSGGIQRYRIPYDIDIVRALEREVTAFLHRVREGTPPTAQDETDMRNRWPVTEGREMEATAALMEQLKTLRAIRDQIAALEKDKSDLQAIVLGYAQDAENLTYEGSTVATLSVNRKFDEDRLLQEHPEMLSQFAKLDTTKLRAQHKALVEQYMSKPTDPTKATRVIRLKLPNGDV